MRTGHWIFEKLCLGQLVNKLKSLLTRAGINHNCRPVHKCKPVAQHERRGQTGSTKRPAFCLACRYSVRIHRRMKYMDKEAGKFGETGKE